MLFLAFAQSGMFNAGLSQTDRRCHPVTMFIVYTTFVQSHKPIPCGQMPVVWVYQCNRMRRSMIQVPTNPEQHGPLSSMRVLPGTPQIAGFAFPTFFSSASSGSRTRISTSSASDLPSLHFDEHSLRRSSAGRWIPTR